MTDEEIQFELKSIIANDPFLRRTFKIGIWDHRKKKYRKPTEKDIEKLQDFRKHTNAVLEKKKHIEEFTDKRNSLMSEIYRIDEIVKEEIQEINDIQEAYPEVFSEKVEIL